MTKAINAVIRGGRFGFALVVALVGSKAFAVTYTTNTYNYNYSNRTALVNAGWDFIAKTAGGAVRNTESTNGASPPDVSYDQSTHPGALRVPVTIGDLWDRSTNDLRYPLINNTTNTLFRHLSSNWVSLRLEASLSPNTEYEQVNLTLYQDDDNFVSVAHTYNTYEQVNLSLQTQGYSLGSPRTVNATGVASADVHLRLDRDPLTDKLSAYYSPDETNWIFIGETTHALVNPRVCIWIGGHPASTKTCDVRRLDVVTSDDPILPVLAAQPQQLVFQSIVGQPCTNLQQLRIVSRVTQAALSYTIASNSIWLSASLSGGSTPGSCDVSVDTTGLAVGTHVGTLQIDGAGVVSAVVTVKLIVNPDDRARVATWRGDKAGAMTVWIDDSHVVAFDKLNTNGFAGTYALWGIAPIPGIFTNYYLAGMEMAGHTHDHPCFEVNEPTRRYEIEQNSREILARTPATQAELISFAWPCGHTTIKEQAWAADYFLSARGYNINSLEDASPQNWMNLKSYNSHDTVPLPPSDFKTIVDSAITQGKWANLVFHSTDEDNGAISYAVGKDIWVDRADRVAKYVHQRDRTVITNYSESSSLIQFNTYRLPIDPSPLRSFETAFKTNDTLTFSIDVSGYSGMYVSSVLVNGSGAAFTRAGNQIRFDALVTTNSKTVAISFLTNTPPSLPAQTNRFVDELTLLTITNTATDSDVPTQLLSYSLAVTNTLSGNVQTNAWINAIGVISWTPTEAQGAGTYSFTTIVADGGITPLNATNSFMVSVNEINVPPTLPSQPDRMIFGNALATFVNAATDSDVPSNPLGYSLTVTNLSDNTQVTNASISAGGIITWTPTMLQIPSTNLFTTVVTDTNILASNSQNLHTTNTFIVIALDTPLVLTAQTNRVINELTSINVTNTALNLTNQSRSGWIATNRVAFNYTDKTSLLADGWSFWATNAGVGRNSEITDTNMGVIAFGETNSAVGTVMRVPNDLGDLWSALNDTRNSLFRDLSTNWLSTRLKLAFDPTSNYQQAHLVLYQNDDNYVEVGVGYNSGSKNMLFIQETSGVPVVVSSVAATTSNLVLRLDRDPSDGNISAFFSVDETNWVLLGQISQSLTNARLGIWSGAATSPYTTTLQNCDFAWLDVVTTNTMPPPLYTLLVTNTVNNSVVTNVSINNQGVISWTPSEAQGPGIYTFTTSVNEGLLNISNIFTVTVTEVNVAPVYAGTPVNTTIAELSTLTVTNEATDVDVPANVLTYTLVNPPGNAAISSQGVITWTPSEAEGPGTNTIVTVVSDGTASVTNSFEVIVTEVNVAPVYAGTPVNTTIAELSTLTVTNEATDVDVPANVLTYTLVNPPGNAAISSQGVITWTPSEAEGPGTNTIVTVVSDGTASVTNSFEVIVTEVNVAPVYAGTPVNTTIAELSTLTVTNEATDVDVPANVLTYTLVNPPGNAAISSQGVITWTPSEAEGPGTNTIVTVVSDGTASVTNSFEVIVTEVNVAPVYAGTPVNTTIAELSTLTVTNEATDVDVPANVLTYTLVNPPGNAAISSQGVITWTPSEAEGPGTNTIVTVVSDGTASVTNSFEVIVTEVNVAPVYAGTPVNTTIAELSTLTVTNEATDVDVPANVLTYTLVNPPGNAAISSQGVITWTPSEAEGPGTNTIVTVVSDGTASVTNSFEVIVTEVNVAPVYAGTPVNTTIAELSTLTVTNEATDVDVPANVLTYTLVNPPGNAAISSQGVITWTPSEAEGPGTNTIVTVVSDGTASVTNSFEVIVTEVNVAPVYAGTPVNTTIAELSTLTVTNEATDVDVPANVLTYTLVNPPGNAAISSQGVITWTPSEAEGPGTNTIVTVVSDGTASVTNSFEVIVTEVNVAPVYAGTPVNTTIAELSTLTVTNEATDVDVPANVLTYTLVNPPGNAAISSQGVITWTPSEAEGPGTNTIVTVVSDGTASVTNSFEVIVTEVNVAPVYAGTPVNTTIAELSTLTVTNEATDVDVPANVLTYTLVNPPGNAAISSQGVITWTPSEAEGPGTNTIVTVVSDGTASVTNSFEVIVTEVNVAPVYAGTPVNTTIAELSTLTVTNEATDVDVPANVLTYTLVNPPGNAAISSQGVITWTPSEAEGPGTNTIVTVVSDGTASVTNSFEVIVTEVNVAPVYAGTPVNTTIAELSTLTVTNEATDVDVPANVLTYTLVNPPGNAAISSQGVITWTPSEAEGPGTNTIVTVVSDGTASVTNSFEVIVTEVNVAPVYAGTPVNTTIAELSTLTVTNEATDVDVPANVLTYTLVNPPGNAAISSQGVITWTPSEAEGPGTNTIVTVVSDGTASVTNSFEVIVTEVNVAPVYAGTPVNTTIAELSTLTVTNEATDVDVPANVLTYTLVNPPGNAAISSQGVITWTPSEAEGPGTNTIVTVVSDGTASVTNSFEVIVTEVNVAPVYAGTPVNTTIAELSTLTVTNEATDVDVPANVLTYTLVNPPGNAAISSQGVITWTPSEAEGPGTNTIVTVVSDGTASVTNSFEVIVTEVNVAPVYAGTPVNTTIAELSTLTVTNEATDVDVPANVLTYTLVNPPGNAAISSQGVITWTPSEAEGPGTNTIVTVVSDGTASVTNSFEVIVTEVNVAPVYAGTPVNTTIAELSTLTVTNEATDVDVPANVLTYTLVNPPGNAAISSQGVITWTPSEAEGPGTNTIVTVVSDGTASVTNSFEVIVTEVNVAPVYAGTPVNTTIAELSTLTVTNEATDVDVPANVLTYTLVNPPGNAAISSQGVITWTPSEAEGPGTNTIVTVVSDGTASVTNSFEVIVTEVNVAPVYAGTPVNTTIAELSTLTVTNEATDVDVPANVLTYTLVNPPGNAAISSQGVITWTPSEAEGPGTNTIVTVVSDGTASVTNSFEVIVTEVNVAPVYAGTPVNTTIAELSTLTVTNEATDVDVPANVLTYTLVNPPGNAAISSQGVITWTPSEAEGPGTNTIVTVVSDGTASVTNSFEVIVTEVNVAPVYAGTPVNTTIAELSTLTVTNEATDVDVPANVLTYTLVNPPGNAAISSQGVITWTPSEAEGPGTNTIVTVVSDGTASVTNSFEVIVTEVNVAPVYAGTPVNTTIAELSTLTVTNEATDVDVPANVLTYTLVNPPGNAAISSQGVITWTPSEAEGPGTNTIVTVVSDGTASVTNSFEVIVTEVNVAPVAVNNSYYVTNSVFTVAAGGVLLNDSDADLPTNVLTAVLVSGPTNGILILSSNGGFTYTPNNYFNGLDVFTYRAHDGLTNSEVATVSITVSNRPFIITSVVVNAGAAVVTWNSTPGLSYRVQYKDSLAASLWADVNPVITAMSISSSVTNTVGSTPQRFYRVQIVETPQPVILSLTITNGVATITWSSVPGRMYGLQFKSELTDLTWSEVFPNIQATDLTTTTTNVVGSSSQRFYRVYRAP